MKQMDNYTFYFYNVMKNLDDAKHNLYAFLLNNSKVMSYEDEKAIYDFCEEINNFASFFNEKCY